MVRIYCLANFKKLNPEENQVNIYPYLNGADELVSLASEIYTIKNLRKAADMQIYKLTEICIGFKEVNYYNYVRQKHEKNVKFYIINIYREDIGLLEFKMLRGCFKFEKVKYIDADAYDLIISTSKIFSSQQDFDLRIRIRCIKTTSVKGIISEEEEKIYNSFAIEIEEFCHFNDNDIEDDEDRVYIQDEIREEEAFEVNIMILPNQSKPNVLRTMLSDINILIKRLCNPQNGAFKNIPQNARYNQKLKCFLNERHTWNANNPRYGELSHHAGKYHGLRALHWENVNLRPENLNNANLSTLTTIIFTNMTIFDDTTQLISGFPKNAFPSLKILTLINCFIKVVPEYFMNMLPTNTLKMLCLSFNDIKQIPKSISLLTKLSHLMLHNNPNLTEDGIPWNELPPSIGFLTLDNTNVTRIPDTIQRLKGLFELHLGNAKFHDMSWKNISCNLRILLIFGGFDLTETCFLTDKHELRRLKIINANIQKISYSTFPQSIRVVDFSNNALRSFGNKNSFLNLTELHLNNNELESVAWQFLPSTLISLSLNNNAIKFIGDISHLKNLIMLKANFNNIERILPGMKDLKNLKFIELKHNNFRYSHNDDLIEFLWMQLPISFFYLDLSYNKIRQIPCFLKNLNILKLKVNNCEISHICPYFYTAFLNIHQSHNQKQQRIEVEIEDNPDLKYLPFLPKNIYQPSLSKIEPVDEIKSQGLILSIKGKNYVSNAEFPRNQFWKPVYPFKTYLAGNNFTECKCCSNCGDATSFSIKKQLMVMDFALHFYKNAKNKYYPAGQWNSNVLIRLCKNCSENVKHKTDDAFMNYMSFLVKNIGFAAEQFSKLNINNKHKNYEENESSYLKKAKTGIVINGPSEIIKTVDEDSNVTHKSYINSDKMQTYSNVFYKLAHKTMQGCDISNIIFSQEFQAIPGSESFFNNWCRFYNKALPYQPQETLTTLKSRIFYSNPDPGASILDYPNYPKTPLVLHEETETENHTFYTNFDVMDNEGIYSQMMYHEPQNFTSPQDPFTLDNHYVVQYSFQDVHQQNPKASKLLPPVITQNISSSAMYSICNDSQVLTVNPKNDIEFLHIIQQQPSNILPPTTSWLQEKCKIFGIPFFENVSHNRQSIADIQKFTIRTSNDIINVPSDGHCGYSSISVLLCGSNFYHGKIRSIICSKIIQNSDLNFENLDIFRNAKAIAKAKLEIDASKPCTPEYWMDDADLAAAAFIINCNIYILNSMDDWQIYGPNTFINGQMNTFVNYDPALPTLLMQNKSGDHFTPVKNVWLKEG